MSELTVREYAAKEQVTERTVRRWIAIGALPPLKEHKIAVMPDAITLATRIGYDWTWFSGVYFVQCEGFVKIGLAQDVRLRLNGIQGNNPFPVTPLAFIQCGSCEWFRADQSVLQYAKEHGSLWPSPQRKVSHAG